MYLIPLVQYVIVGLLLLSVSRCEVIIQSLLQIKITLWNNRFFFGKLFTSLNFVLSLAIVAVFMVEDQIYGLVLCLYGTGSISTVKRYRLQERALVSCSKASKLFSSNHKEQVVLRKIQCLSGLTEEKAQHFLIQTVFFVSVI